MFHRNMGRAELWESGDTSHGRRKLVVKLSCDIAVSPSLTPFTSSVFQRCQPLLPARNDLSLFLRVQLLQPHEVPLLH